MNSPIANLAGEGPYKPTWDSLLQYEAPEWYRDAKFGIWAHWSPQCVPEAGDWYARNMYIEEASDYKYHLQHYGPPSRFGYKDLCAQWTLLNWEPDALIARYKKAGAKFFIALANHHDGFDAWDSKHQPWNAATIGPHRDVVGTWAAAARKQGLRFGVTVHQARNWWWFQTSHGADKAGPLAGVPYDGDLTAGAGQRPVVAGTRPAAALRREASARCAARHLLCQEFLRPHARPDRPARSRPALLRQSAVSAGLGRHEHRRLLLQPQPEDAWRQAWKRVLNIKERARSPGQSPGRRLRARAHQRNHAVSLAVGDLHRRVALQSRALYDKPGEYGGYLPPRDVIHWLIDTVSKNGTFVLNIPGKPDGTIDSKEIAVLDDITAWMQVNGEASTRPGRGRSMAKGRTW